MGDGQFVGGSDECVVEEPSLARVGTHVRVGDAGGIRVRRDHESDAGDPLRVGGDVVDELLEGGRTRAHHAADRTRHDRRRLVVGQIQTGVEGLSRFGNRRIAGRELGAKDQFGEVTAGLQHDRGGAGGSDADTQGEGS